MAQRVGIHGRKSLVVEEGTAAPSIAVQHDKGRAWAEARGYVVAETYAENISAWSGKERSEMDRAMDDLMAGRIDILWCFAIDRFTRQGARVILEIMDTTPASDRPWIIFDYECMDTRNDAFRMPLIFAAEQALAYSNRLSVNVKGAKARQRQTGGWSTRAPYGFVTVGPKSSKRLEIDPATWPVIVRIYEAAANGDSTRVIARALNADGIAGPKGEWSAVSVRRVLIKPCYEGFQFTSSPNGNRFPIARDAAGEPIRVLPEGQGIDPTLATKAREAISGNDFAPDVPKPGTPMHLLAGLLRCDGCDGAMISSGHSYVCDRRHRGQECAAPASASRKSLEEHVTAAFMAQMIALDPADDADSEMLAVVGARWQAVTRPKETREAREARAAVEAAETVLARHMELESRMQAVRDIWLSRLDELAADVVAARQRADSLAPITTVDISFLLDGELLADAWRDATTADRRAYLALAIDSVTVCRAPRRGVPFDGPARCVVTWPGAA